MSLADQLWCPTSVQVTVHQARGLRIKGKSGTNDAYAVMQVGKEKYQTSVVEKSVAPVWKEEASFDLPQLLQGGGGGGGGGGTERSTLHVHVLHRALVGPDKLLGQAVINLRQLSEDKSRNKTEWFKLLDKTGKADKDRGEVLVDIQFMKNNMTASMFDLSAAGKSRSRLGKFKDKVRGKKKESDTVSSVVPSFSQVLTDSEEEEGNGDAEASAGKDEKKKKNKMKSLFSPKSNLQKNMSQSMSVLPGKNSSLSGSQSSGLNVDSSEGKKKFKFLIHKRSGSSDSKDSSSGHQKHGAAEQSNLCINGSHIYCEEPQTRTSRIGSSFSLASSGHGSMEEVPESSPPSVDSLRGVRQYSPWTEEEEETADTEYKKDVVELEKEDEERIKMEEERRKTEEEMLRKQEETERLAEEKRKERIRIEEEEKRQREEEERIRMEEERAQEERRRKEEEQKLAEEKKRLEEERRRIEEEKVRQEEEERMRKEEEERAQEERRRQEELERLAEEKRREEQERRRLEEEERIRVEEERARQERMRQEEEEMARRREEERKLAEEKRRLEEEERIRVEEERARQERMRQEEEEMARRREEECKLAEEKRRLEEEERIRVEDERARQERMRQEEEEMARRREEERKLAEEKRRLEEEEEIRRIEEEKARKEEEERIRREQERAEEERRRQVEEEKLRRQQEEYEENRRLEEQERIRKNEEERIRKEEEENARRQKEEYERQLKEEERKKIVAEEKIRKEEEERLRMEEERRRKEEEEAANIRRQEEEQRLAEEKKIQEEQERRRIEEEEKREREENERIRKKEEDEDEQEKIRMKKETRRKQEEEKQRIFEEEERIKREEDERIRRQEKAKEEAMKLETREAEEQKMRENKTKNKDSGTKNKAQSPAEVISTNPFDEDFTNNPFDEGPGSPEESTVKNRSESAVSLLGSKTGPTDVKDLISTQREKRQAPQPPGRNKAQRQEEQEGSAHTLAQINKQSKDKDIKTVSVPPQRSVQVIAPLSRSPTDATAQSLTQGSATTSTTNVTKHSKRPAPPRPQSVEGEPVSELKTASSSNDKTSKECGSEAKQEAIVYGLNPFEDEDEDELPAQNDTTNTDSVKWPPAVSQAADKESTSQAKIRSSKVAHAPPVPVKEAATSSALNSQNSTGGHVSDDSGVIVPDNRVTHPCDPQIVELPTQKSQPEMVKSTGEEKGGKKEGPPVASRRLLPVKPLNPLGQQSISLVQGERDKNSSEVQQKSEVIDTGIKGPYSQLTREELISLVLKQENQLSQKDDKISELEQYIDNLLVRVMEEEPSILMSMNSMKKPV